ncbi:hypothetical protein EVJ58_g3117 [Rhodofomes roseus]|uniref:BTB domain-containing protein n=1 Tax=Rhodofomes roseus TaxID=34475 RepID=A0A4Y9YM67_9APHY|nr:hypothetical protein EVJ58_g3117 [Rhodofomes roseus]
MSTQGSLQLRHERFYLEDGNAVFQVESLLFRVHASLFKNSPIFSDIIRASFNLDSNEGRSDKKPILLTGTAATNFECFLSCFYPSRTSWQVDDMPFKAWASVFDLAMKWQFDDVRDLAVRHLQDIRTDAPTLAGQIALASRHRLEGWYWEACLKICERAPPLSEDEGAQLGLAETVRLSAIRQTIRSRASQSLTSGSRAHMLHGEVSISPEDHGYIKKELHLRVTAADKQAPKRNKARKANIRGSDHGAWGSDEARWSYGWEEATIRRSDGVWETDVASGDEF